MKLSQNFTQMLEEFAVHLATETRYLYLCRLSADCQPQWLRAGGLEESGEGREQSKEAPEEEGEQSSPRNQHTD